MTTPTARVAANVRAIRKAHGLSAQALSGLCATVGHPISRVSISNLECGRRTEISLDEFIALAGALNVPPMDLLNDDPDYAAARAKADLLRAQAAALIAEADAIRMRPRLRPELSRAADTFGGSIRVPDGGIPPMSFYQSSDDT